MPVTITSRLLHWLMPTPLGAFARSALKLQAALWRTRPGLVERLSDFVPIGVASTAIQIALFMLLPRKSYGRRPNGRTRQSNEKEDGVRC